MGDDLIKKLLHLVGSSKRQQPSESQEDMVKRLIQEQIASQSQAGASGVNTADLQNLIGMMKFQLDHALAEKSELAMEKVKRLQAEKEADDLKKKLAEMKLNDHSDQRKVDSIEKKLHDLELENLKNDGEDLEKLLKKLLSKESGGQIAGNQKPDLSSEKSGKGYDDPPWFPGSSNANDSSNHSSGFSREKVLHKDLLNGQPPASAPPLYDSLFPNARNTGPFTGHSSPFPPNHPPNMQHPYPNMPPQYSNMSNFQSPQFPFDGRNMPPPPYNQQFFGPMPANQGFNSQQQPYFNAHQQFHRPNFTQGPDQVRFTGKNQQSKNKFQKQFQPTPKGDQQKQKQKQQQSQKGDQSKQPKQQQQQKGDQPKQPKQQQQQKGDQPKQQQQQMGNQPKQPKKQQEQKGEQPKQPKQSQPQKADLQKQPQKIDQQSNINEEKPGNQSLENNGETPKKTKTRRKKSKQTNNQEIDNDNVGEDVVDNSITDSINLSGSDIKNVKKAINIKKKNDEQLKPGAKTTFKKKKNRKNSSGANAEGGAESDSNSNEDNESIAQQGDTQNSGPAQEIGGAKKKDLSGKKAKAPKSQKKQEKADANLVSSPTGDLNLFVGEQIPTMKDVESGRVKLTQEVKGVFLIAMDGDNTVTETPKVVQDMILFQRKYPKAKLIIATNKFTTEI